MGTLRRSHLGSRRSAIAFSALQRLSAEEPHMLRSKLLAQLVVGTAAAALVALAPGAAFAQGGEPIRIGFSMALTGPLAANGKQALLGMKIWEEEVNQKGGLLGRPGKLIHYDDH